MDMEVEYSKYGKICLVCSCGTKDPPKGERDSFRLYIIDLDESISSNSLSPVVRIGGSYSLYANAFCILDSTVYIFGTLSEPWGGISVYTYELKPNDSYTRLSPRFLVQIDDMHAFKFYPEATPTPDRKKVIVFSSTIVKLSKILNPDKVCDVELYDPVVGCWEKLAAFPNSWRNEDIKIRAYTFVENENVLLLLSDDTAFTLDFRSQHQRWERTPRNPGYNVGMSQYFLLVGKDMYVSPLCVRDKEDWFEIPGLSEVGCSIMALLDKNDSRYQFCTIQSQLDKLYKNVVRPRLTINVCKFDYNKYKEEKEKRKLENKKRKRDENSDSESEMENPLPGATVVKSFEFNLDEEPDDGWLFGPHAVFSIASRSKDLLV